MRELCGSQAFCPSSHGCQAGPCTMAADCRCSEDEWKTEFRIGMGRGVQNCGLCRKKCWIICWKKGMSTEMLWFTCHSLGSSPFCWGPLSLCHISVTVDNKKAQTVHRRTDSQGPRILTKSPDKLSPLTEKCLPTNVCHETKAAPQPAGAKVSTQMPRRQSDRSGLHKGTSFRVFRELQVVPRLLI